MFPGTASMVTSASCPILTFTMLFSSTFTSAGTIAISPQANRQIADDAVNGRNVGGLAENVARTRQNRLVLAELRARLFDLRLQLLHSRCSRVHRGCGRVVRRFALIKILFRDQPVLI